MQWKLASTWTRRPLKQVCRYTFLSGGLGVVYQSCGNQMLCRVSCESPPLSSPNPFQGCCSEAEAQQTGRRQTPPQPMQCELPIVPVQIGPHFLKGVSFNESAADNLKLKTVAFPGLPGFQHLSVNLERELFWETWGLLKNVDYTVEIKDGGSNWVQWPPNAACDVSLCVCGARGWTQGLTSA